jgi:hypothetical protein
VSGSTPRQLAGHSICAWQTAPVEIGWLTFSDGNAFEPLGNFAFRGARIAALALLSPPIRERRSTPLFSAAIFAYFSRLGCFEDVSLHCAFSSHRYCLIATVVDDATGPNSSGLKVLHEAFVPL